MVPAWTAWKGNVAKAHNHPDEAVRWYRQSLRFGGNPLAILPVIINVEESRGNQDAAKAAYNEYEEAEQRQIRRDVRDRGPLGTGGQ